MLVVATGGKGAKSIGKRKRKSKSPKPTERTDSGTEVEAEPEAEEEDSLSAAMWDSVVAESKFIGENTSNAAAVACDSSGLPLVIPVPEMPI